MTIEVKGARAQPREADPAQRYVLQDAERKSKIPAIFGIFLVGIALYLKSIFPGSADPEKEKPSPDKEPDGQVEARLAQTQFDEPPALDNKPTGTVPEPDATGGGGRLVDLMAPAEFITVESPAMEDFRLPETEEWWKEFQPLKLEVQPANDNTGGGGGSPGHEHPGGADPDDNEEIPGEVDPAGPEDPHDREPDPSCGDGDREEPCVEDPGEPCEDDPQAANRAPRISGPVYLMDVTGCAILTIALSDLLRNAVDPDGDALAVENLTLSSGNLSQSGDGWIFQSEPRLLGPVTISYEITDGEFTVEQTAHFSVVRSFIGGTDEDDLLLGTMCADDMDGGSGDDNMDGRAGNDVLNGGEGDDHIVAGSGDDIVSAGSGDDIVFGGAGNDHLSGGVGNDRLFGDEGDDVIFGDAGHDTLAGGAGDDLLSGGAGNDTVAGDAGDDTISGGTGDDVLDGGSGHDVIDGGSGNDIVWAGEGDDTILDGSGNDVIHAEVGDDTVVASTDGHDDLYDGGSGCDTLDYSAATKNLAIDLTTGSACGLEIGEDSISGFEAVIGGQGEDHFIAGRETAVMTGGNGDDLFEFIAAEPVGTHDSVVHEIMDFRVGDRIRMSKYDIFEKVLDEMEDRFEDIYGDSFDDDDVPIRISHDWVEDMKRTVVEADLNRDDIYETTVAMHGHYVLVVVENV